MYQLSGSSQLAPVMPPSVGRRPHPQPIRRRGVCPELCTDGVLTLVRVSLEHSGDVDEALEPRWGSNRVGGGS